MIQRHTRGNLVRPKGWVMVPMATTTYRTYSIIDGPSFPEIAESLGSAQRFFYDCDKLDSLAFVRFKTNMAISLQSVQGDDVRTEPSHYFYALVVSAGLDGVEAGDVLLQGALVHAVSDDKSGKASYGLIDEGKTFEIRYNTLKRRGRIKLPMAIVAKRKE